MWLPRKKSSARHHVVASSCPARCPRGVRSPSWDSECVQQVLAEHGQDRLLRQSNRRGRGARRGWSKTCRRDSFEVPWACTDPRGPKPDSRTTGITPGCFAFQHLVELVGRFLEPRRKQGF
eukprot:1658106-Pyramimonas_sp.AAC.1